MKKKCRRRRDKIDLLGFDQVHAAGSIKVNAGLIQGVIDTN
jgi:hypothetical protein